MTKKQCEKPVFIHPPSEEMQDTGQRKVYKSGAHRDRGTFKSRPDFVSPFFLERLGVWLGLAAQKKYPEWNWAKGLPQSDCFASLCRHVLAFQQGDRKEDHLAGVAANVMFLMHNEEMFKKDWLPAELNDMPQFDPTKQKVKGELR